MSEWAEIDSWPDPEPQIELGDSAFHGCRFISGDPVPIRPSMFCCRPVSEPGGSWCPAHRERVWRRVPRRRVA